MKDEKENNMTKTTFQSLKKNLKKDFSSLKIIKIAVLGDSATQMYVQAIKGYGYELGINFDVFEADYNQIELQVYNAISELYEFKPEYVVIFYCTNKLLKKYGERNLTEKPVFAKQQIDNFSKLYQTIGAQLKCKVIFFNFHEINDAVFGNYGDKINISFVYQLRKINFELMNLAQKHKNLFILDINILQGQYGHDFITDNKIYINTDLLLSIDFLPIVAKNTIDIIQSINGKFNKCLILDLDNTIWGGIIGDDGIENIQIGELGIGKAFSELQLWVKQLKQRGIIIAVCSKNDEAVAKEPFEKHPDMILRLDDIAVFVANWNNKADNIKYIQNILNIGFDSMVFLDDNQFERNMVRTFVPDITIPELPEDPAEYLNYLRTLNLFETASFTYEDEQRTVQYQEETKRTILQQQFTNENDFLKSLNMVSLVEPFNAFNTPRVAQLTQRSNQFNLRTIRYTEDEIQIIANDPTYITMAFSLSDKYGDYGLISLIILKKVNCNTLFVDTWIMSCRVLKRNMENFVLNTIVNLAIEQGFSSIRGEYLPTAKNNMVKDHYKNLGFTVDGNSWNLVMKNYNQKECYIKIK
jgi:FkbH-like protein